MEQVDKILSLPELALQYGTINTEQFTHIHRLHALKLKGGDTTDFDILMINQKYATSYQVGLLKLIQEFLIIKKRGEVFGKIAINKGFATQADVDKAIAHQDEEFKRAKIRKLIGDILVEAQVLTIKQKNEILKEQTFLDTQAEKFFTSDPTKEIESKGEQGQLVKKVGLSPYEEQFLKVKVLDKEFAASVLEKGLASEGEVKIAQKVQEEEFEKENKIRILGDLMVDLNYLTEEQKNLILKEQNRIEGNDEIAVDSKILVSISEDQMEAVIKIEKGDKVIGIEDIKQALAARKVEFGIYPDAVLQCNLDMGNSQFVAAKQDFSFEMIKDKKALYHFETGKLNIETKKKGSTLAEQHLGEETYLKKDIFGNNVEQKGCGLTFRCASGTIFSKDYTKALAGKTGFPYLSIEKKLYIHPIINVLEDADLRYGPLEKYANLNISGVLTGAYPVSAGTITAQEIRGARIEALGSVKSEVGITNSTISAQGDIYARYLHNCRIETFGNVYIKNEIIDSQVFCSGKIDSGNCHAIASTLYGKKGIELGGAGNTRTKACILGAGTEHHILEKARQINREVKKISQDLDELIEKKDEQNFLIKKTFQKMVELKIFHDRAKNRKRELANEFKNKKSSYKKEELKNLITLINNFDKRIESTLSSLKTLNKTKKNYENKKKVLEEKIQKMEPKIKREISELQIDLFAFFEWTRKQENLPKVKINKKVFATTIIKGIFSSMEVEKDLSNFSVFEKQNSKNNFELVLKTKS